MNNAPPIQRPAGEIWSPEWANWFQQVFACLPWKRGFNVTATLDFPLIAAQSETSLTVTVTGAAIGDAASVTSSAHTAGINYSAMVTAANTVTVYAQNFTAGGINPASGTFRVIVLQN